MNVIEIYKAAQGEGMRVGQPTVFVRLAGCTVGCRWCDTKFSWKAAQGTTYTPQELCDAFLQYGINSLVLTGGEPMQHPAAALGEFLDLTVPHVRDITIETSGIVFPAFTLNTQPPFPLLWSVAPKLPAAKTRTTFPNLRKWVDIATSRGEPIQFKFVVSSQLEIDLVKILLHTHNISTYVPVIIQPTTVFKPASQPEVVKSLLTSTRQMQEYLLKQDWTNKYQIYIRPQMHALLYGQKRGI